MPRDKVCRGSPGVRCISCVFTVTKTKGLPVDCHSTPARVIPLTGHSSLHTYRSATGKRRRPATPSLGAGTAACGKPEDRLSRHAIIAQSEDESLRFLDPGRRQIRWAGNSYAFGCGGQTALPQFSRRGTRARCASPSKGGGARASPTSSIWWTPPNADDLILEKDDAKVLIDSLSLVYMGGSEIDFVDNLLGQSFQIKQSERVASCGCGTSFSI